MTARCTAGSHGYSEEVPEQKRSGFNDETAEEIQQVYDKYGVSMMGGCLPLLIQMPFLFALYPVIYRYF